MPRQVDLFSGNFKVDHDPTKRISWNNTALTQPPTSAEALAQVFNDGLKAFFTEISKVLGFDFSTLGNILVSFGHNVIDGVQNLATGIRNFIGEVGTASLDAAGNIIHGLASFVQNIVNGLVGGFQNIVTTIDMALGIPHVTAAANGVRVAIGATGVGALGLGAASSGTSVFLNFQNYANTSYVPGFTQTYSGSGSGTLGVSSGAAAWIPATTTASRSVMAIYTSTPTLTDYQVVGAVFFSIPGFDSFGNRAYNYLYGRVDNPSSPGSYIYVQFGSDSCTLGCVTPRVGSSSSGGTAVWATASGFTFSPGAVYWLLCGTTAGPRTYAVMNGSTPIITYTETGTTSKLNSHTTDASDKYRYGGFGDYNFATLLGHLTPAATAAWALADSTTPGS